MEKKITARGFEVFETNLQQNITTLYSQNLVGPEDQSPEQHIQNTREAAWFSFFTTWNIQSIQKGVRLNYFSVENLGIPTLPHCGVIRVKPSESIISKEHNVEGWHSTIQAIKNLAQTVSESTLLNDTYAEFSPDGIELPVSILDLTDLALMSPKSLFDVTRVFTEQLEKPSNLTQSLNPTVKFVLPEHNNSTFANITRNLLRSLKIQQFGTLEEIKENIKKDLFHKYGISVLDETEL